VDDEACSVSLSDMGEVANVPLEFIIVWNVGDINADGEPTEYAGRWMLRRLNREL
jgi:hypothetical protein